MPITITKEKFNSYFENIEKPVQKIGALDKVEGNVITASEHKSEKSGKTSIKLEIDYQGFVIKTYLGISSEKSIEISRSRLLRLAIASVGVEESKRLFQEAANDEDVDDDVSLLLEFTNKLNKKLRKNPVPVIVSRTKDEAKGVWNVSWYIKDENIKKESNESRGSEDSIFDD